MRSRGPPRHRGGLRLCRSVGHGRHGFPARSLLSRRWAVLGDPDHPMSRRRLAQRSQTPPSPPCRRPAPSCWNRCMRRVPRRLTTTASWPPSMRCIGSASQLLRWRARLALGAGPPPRRRRAAGHPRRARSRPAAGLRHRLLRHWRRELRRPAHGRPPGPARPSPVLPSGGHGRAGRYVLGVRGSPQYRRQQRMGAAGRQLGGRARPRPATAAGVAAQRRRQRGAQPDSAAARRSTSKHPVDTAPAAFDLRELRANRLPDLPSHRRSADALGETPTCPTSPLTRPPRSGLTMSATRRSPAGALPAQASTTLCASDSPP